MSRDQRKAKSLKRIERKGRVTDQRLSEAAASSSLSQQRTKTLISESVHVTNSKSTILALENNIFEYSTKWE